MTGKVILSGVDLDHIEIDTIKKELITRDVEFEILKTTSLLDDGYIVIMIQLLQDIGANAIYDILKLCITIVLSSIYCSKKKNKNKYKNNIEVICNGRKYSAKIDFELSEEQKDKLIDAIVMKLTKEEGDNE